jgi:hypothetical protein
MEVQQLSKDSAVIRPVSAIVCALSYFRPFSLNLPLVDSIAIAPAGAVDVARSQRSRRDDLVVRGARSCL